MEYTSGFLQDNPSRPCALKSELKLDDLCLHRVKDGRFSHRL
jgi:hypothetical protein